jgi:hypothetical protein
MNESQNLQRACRLGNVETVKEILECKPFLKDAVISHRLVKPHSKYYDILSRFWTTIPGHRSNRSGL